MKIIVEYFNNNIELLNDNVFAIEIENKVYFYRFVNDLINISNGENVEEIKFFDNDVEVGMTNKIIVLLNYFDFSDVFKKYITSLIKVVCSRIELDEKERSLFKFNRVCSFVSNEINKIDLPFYLKTDFTFESMLKSLKFDIIPKESVLDNLFLLIDIERELRSNNLLLFVNLKQYLNKEELVELYKYSIYNSVNILLVDSQPYGLSNEFEKKLIIDDLLDEFML